jgi:hypothetical protein
MPLHPALIQVTLIASLTLVSLSACRQQTAPPPPAPASEAPTQVTPSTDLRGASDHRDAPPAIGALTGGQAASGASGRPIQPTAGDGTAAASAASAPRR